VSAAQVQAWLAAREPKPPKNLADRIAALVVNASPKDLDLPLPQALAALGRSVVRQIIQQERPGRESALDLLAADAFITYAFEAQAELDPTGLNRLAKEAWEA
jgi:hypothetical protein